MSEQNTNAPQENAPVFRLQKMYVKDLSLENPNAPEVFMGQNMDPQVELNLGLKNKKLEADDIWEVAISVTAKITNGKSGTTLFIVEVEHAGVFLLQNIPEEHMGAVLAVECAALLFPFTRQIVSQATVDGGFMPFLMEPVNFMALYNNSKKQDVKQQ